MDLGQEPRAVAALTFGEVLTQSLTEQLQASKEDICSKDGPLLGVPFPWRLRRQKRGGYLVLLNFTGKLPL